MNNNVFCYWRNLDGSSNLPPYIQLCFDTIQKYHPQVELITPETLSVDVCDDFGSFIPAHQADYLRPRYIAKYGGLFVDIDTIFFEDFYESEYFSEQAEMISFGYKQNQPTIGVLYGKKDCHYMNQWTKEQDKRIGKNKSWTSLGADSLWKIDLKSSDCHEYPATAIQPFRWTETEKFNQDIELEKQLCFALFNKVLPKNIKEMSRKELLESEKLIGKLFRKALGNE